MSDPSGKGVPASDARRGGRRRLCSTALEKELDRGEAMEIIATLPSPFRRSWPAPTAGIWICVGPFGGDHADRRNNIWRDYDQRKDLRSRRDHSSLRGGGKTTQAALERNVRP